MLLRSGKQWIQNDFRHPHLDGATSCNADMRGEPSPAWLCVLRHGRLAYVFVPPRPNSLMHIVIPAEREHLLAFTLRRG